MNIVNKKRNPTYKDFFLMRIIKNQKSEPPVVNSWPHKLLEMDPTISNRVPNKGPAYGCSIFGFYSSDIKGVFKKPL